jgi:hypothetical protein
VAVYSFTSKRLTNSSHCRTISHRAHDHDRCGIRFAVEARVGIDTFNNLFEWSTGFRPEVSIEELMDAMIELVMWLCTVIWGG